MSEIMLMQGLGGFLGSFFFASTLTQPHPDQLRPFHPIKRPDLEPPLFHVPIP